VLLASAHKASDGDHRRLYNTQFPVAGQAGAVAKQKGHGACYLSGGQGIFDGVHRLGCREEAVERLGQRAPGAVLVGTTLFYKFAH